MFDFNGKLYCDYNHDVVITADLLMINRLIISIYNCSTNKQEW